MKIYTFESEQWLPRPLDEVFAFFADPGNLQILTPPWLKFAMLTPVPIEMKPGSELGRTYPKPIVGHAFARQRALAALATMKKRNKKRGEK